MCADDVPAEERDSFQAFAELLSSLLHHEFRARLEALKERYHPFDPETDMRTIIEPDPAERWAAEALDLLATLPPTLAQAIEVASALIMNVRRVGDTPASVPGFGCC